MPVQENDIRLIRQILVTEEQSREEDAQVILTYVADVR